MKNNKALMALLILLIVSLLFNGLLLKGYIDKKKNKIEIEKGLIMNEFSQRTKEWRNFNKFLRELKELSEEQFPINKEQSNFYWSLTIPEESVIMKSTKYLDEAHYISNNDYLRFISEFDYEYEWIVDLFRNKLPRMNRDQVKGISSRLDKTYKKYMNEGIGEWGINRPNLYIDFEPNMEVLEEVIKELDLIRDYLDKIK